MRIIALLFAILLLSSPAVADEKISVDGRDRSYTVYRPSGLSAARPVPMVVVLHGGFGTGSQAEKSYRWDSLANDKGFVAVYPDGYRRSWNAGGGCCGPAYRENVDDLKFITAMIRAVSGVHNIDPKRVYLTGISNGAAMSYRYACEGTISISAIGSVSGTMPGGCASPKPVSVMEIHGLKDQNIPFAGGKGTKGVTSIDWPTVQASLEAFRRLGHCKPADATVAGVVTTAVSNCTNGTQIALITVADAGHQWPGAEPNRPVARLLLGLDPPSTAIDATEVLWDFFQRHVAP